MRTKTDPRGWNGNARCRRNATRWWLSFFVSACLVVACIERPPGLQHVKHPETGYVFPPVSEIASIDYERIGGSEFPDFSVPQSCWADLLGALSPSQRDPKPPPWIALGDIWITTRSGAKHYVALYLVKGEPVGAFSAGPSDDSYNAYRGGNSKQLKGAVRQAYALHSSAKSEATEKKPE
jgi:hypothetical protein